MIEAKKRNISPLKSGLRLRCPSCGIGKLYKSFLKLDKACGNCGEDFSHADTADGPAVFVMLIAGFVIVFSALIVEVGYEPPYWVHVMLWQPIVIGLSLALLRPLKAELIASHYRHKILDQDD